MVGMQMFLGQTCRPVVVGMQLFSLNVQVQAFSVGMHIFRLARTICIRCIYSIFGREITRYTVIYSVYIYGSGEPYTSSIANADHMWKCRPSVVGIRIFH
jgi:hypothetical protein